MSTYDLQEQESLAELKAWWQQNGGMVYTVLGIVLLGLAAWNGWTWYQRSQAGQAAVLYEQLQAAVRASDAKAARDAAGAILEQYPRTAYAGLAALLSARASFATGDTKTAKAQLQWAAEHARSEQVKAVARLRLANVQTDDGTYDEALKTLDGTPPKGFEALFNSARGDILVAQKKIPEARAAYQAALGPDDKAAAGSNAAASKPPAADAAPDSVDPALHQLLRLKLDALGGA